MKAQLFVSAALVLLNAIPGVQSAEPQLRGVILVTDFEDQLDLYEYDSESEDEDEDFTGDFDMEPYAEEFYSSEDEDFEPYEEEFYNKGHGRHDGGGRGGGDECRGNRHPYALDEEFASSEDEDFEMEPSEEEFYKRDGDGGGEDRRGGGKKKNKGSSGGSGRDVRFCRKWHASNCGSCGKGRCGWDFANKKCVPKGSSASSGGKKPRNQLKGSGGGGGDVEFCKQWNGSNCGSRGEGRCQYNDNGCVPKGKGRSGASGGKKQRNQPKGSGGGGGICGGFNAEPWNCGSRSRGGTHCTWGDGGCVPGGHRHGPYVRGEE